MTLLEFLIEKNVDFLTEHHHVRPGWAGVDCPQCSPGWKHYRLGFNLAGNYCHCWSCGKLPFFDTLAELTGTQPWEIRKLLDAPLPFKAEKSKGRGRLILPPGVGELTRRHRSYLKFRGFDPDLVAKTWGVKGIGFAQRNAWSLFIPAVYRREVVSWTTRATDPDTRKRYDSARPHEEAVPLKTILYGEDLAGHSVVVVEGPADVWRIGPGAVATFGLAFSPQQFLKIAAYPVRVVAFDSEPAAQAQAKKLCWQLAAFPGRTVRLELDADDPGEASRKEVAKIRREFL